MSSLIHTGIRANNALTVGNADTGQAPIVPFGSAGILNDEFYSAAVGGGFFYFDTSISDVRVGFTFRAGNAGDGPYILFRFLDQNNGLGILILATGRIGLWVRRDGVVQPGALIDAAYVPVVQDRVEVECIGPNISCYVNGVLKFAWNTSLFQNGTLHGIQTAGAARCALLTASPALGFSIPKMWDTDDLVARCLRHARRPAVDASMVATDWYALLTEAQGPVYSDLFTRYPDLQYGPPVLLTTADGGKTYTFGTDGVGDANYPMGHLELYPSLAAIPDGPMMPGDDFMMEGSLIRMRGNRTRQFSSGPYARMILRADDGVQLASGVNPQLQPKHLRMLLVWKALESWAGRPGTAADPSYYITRYTETLLAAWTELATAYNMAAANGKGNADRWWTTMDLSQVGALNN